MKMKDYRISVAMSIYKNDVPEFLEIAIDSITTEQTLLPDEVVIVGDGPLPQTLIDVIDKEKVKLKDTKTKLVFLPQEKNRGLGGALRIACEHCSYPYIARMDSDDISLPQRLEKEMACFKEDDSLTMVGGMITEFVDSPENIVTERILPLDNKHIYEFMKSRCGVNHVTVIIKKDDLMKVGNYSSDYRQEDYYLWARMMKAGCRFRNVPDMVVNVRSGRDQFARRSGMQYFHDHVAIFTLMYSWGLISRWKLVKNYIARFMQVALPGNIKTWVYQHLLRKHK